MKRILASIAIAAAGMTAGASPSFANILNSSDEVKLQRLVPDADFSNLTGAQQSALFAMISTGGLYKAGDNPRDTIRNILSW